MTRLMLDDDNDDGVVFLDSQLRQPGFPNLQLRHLFLLLPLLRRRRRRTLPVPHFCCPSTMPEESEPPPTATQSSGRVLRPSAKNTDTEAAAMVTARVTARRKE